MKRYGAEKIIAIEPIDHRRNISKDFGADVTIDFTGQKATDAILDMTHGAGVDIAIEAVGSAETLNQAMSICKPQGRVQSFGLPTTLKPIPFDSNTFFSKRLTINSNLGSQDEQDLVSVKKSIDLAYNRIFKFHSKQKVKNIFYKDKLQNKLSYKYIPIDSVGIYVPGGTASYPSSVLMNAIPAIIAGVKRIVMVNPRNKGKQNSGGLYAAKKCGIKEIYSIGGAQAVAALAYGTKKIVKVNKIVGPGNLYVTTAKKEVFGDTGIDMIAGPSEITVVGDKYSNPNWIASDLIAQAEHDELSQSILISKDKNLIKKVKK